MKNKAKLPKVGLYSPYLKMRGGGERYLLSIARVLSDKYDVYLFGSRKNFYKALAVFNISLNKVSFLEEDIFQKKNLFKKYTELFPFDMFFYMTDGSLFFSPVGRNFLIIQSAAHIPPLSILNKIKLRQWKILCYSNFMQKIISERLDCRSSVLPPSINFTLLNKKTVEKKNIILTVGRFFPYPHNKKQDFLIEVFKKYYKKCFSGWRLVIAGGLTEEGGKNIINLLKEKSQGYPVDIWVNIPYSDLVDLYKEAKIYWHATGYGEDLEKFPERAEHFGITTLEAMSAGALPVVFAAGGQSEIVGDGQTGYLWKTEEELIEKTKKIIDSPILFATIINTIVKKAEEYSDEKFYEKLEKVIDH